MILVCDALTFVYKSLGLRMAMPGERSWCRRYMICLARHNSDGSIDTLPKQPCTLGTPIVHNLVIYTRNKTNKTSFNQIDIWSSCLLWSLTLLLMTCSFFFAAAGIFLICRLSKLWSYLLFFLSGSVGFTKLSDRKFDIVSVLLWLWPIHSSPQCTTVKNCNCSSFSSRFLVWLHIRYLLLL